MKMVASYLEKAIDLEIMAADEPDPKLKATNRGCLPEIGSRESGATEGSAFATIKMRHELREQEPTT
jgi:hypothetical protein